MQSSAEGGHGSKFGAKFPEQTFRCVGAQLYSYRRVYLAAPVWHRSPSTQQERKISGCAYTGHKWYLTLQVIKLRLATYEIVKTLRAMSPYSWDSQCHNQSSLCDFQRSKGSGYVCDQSLHVWIVSHKHLANRERRRLQTFELSLKNS